MGTAVVLDCDTGVDDALALLDLAGRGGTLLGVGSVHGNTTADQAARNTLQVLDVAGLGEVPVCVGAGRPLAEPLRVAAVVHGHDGLGGQAGATSGRVLAGGSAAQQLVGLARRHPAGFTLVATGPLTNLALALLLEPELPRLVPHVVVMGGAARMPGNITATAEANIQHDPEAAAQVFAAGWRVTLVTLDTTMRTLLSEEQLERLRTAGSPQARFAWSIMQFYLDRYATWLPYRTCPLHDPAAMAIALEPDLATYRRVPVQVELAGGYTRGMTVCDLRVDGSGRHDPAWPEVDLVDGFDVDRFHGQFLAALGA